MPHSIGLVADPIDFVNEDVAEPRPLKVVPSLCFGRGLGSNAGDMKINRLMVVDRERGIAFHKPFAIAATADSTLLDILDKGKGHGDPSADAVEGREGREVCFLGRPALRVRRRRLWSTVGMPARAASGAEPQPRQDCRYYDAPGSGADLSSAATAIRHTQIPGFQEGRIFTGRSWTACAPTASPCRDVLETYADYDPPAFRAHEARLSSRSIAT